MEVIWDEKSHKTIERIAKLSDKWQKDLQNQPVQMLFQTILDDIDCIAYIRNQKEKVWLLQELKTLFDFIKLENSKNGRMSLDEFLATISQMRQYSITIPLVKSTYAKEAVQLTTIHGAKGLEYEYVFLMSCTSNKWESKRANNRGFKLPYGLLNTAEKEFAREDERRLFFVAITRAKKKVQISYSIHDWNEKELTPSLYVTEIENSNSIEKQQKQLSNKDILNIMFCNPERNYLSRIARKNLLKTRLDSYKLSVTHLNNYLECPLKFYYNNFIQIPGAKNANMAFGIAVHDTIEAIFKTMKGQEGIYPTDVEIKDMAMRYMYKQQDSFTKKEYNQKLEYLQRFMPLYFNKYVDGWNKNILLEERIEATYKEMPLRGFVDKIEIDKNNVAIIDYKTGDFKYKKGKQIFEKPLSLEKLEERELKNREISHEHLYGGNYWRQADFL